jgi:CelD/BcsL family acetyltransferase involved in cellulose biosynthesis
MPRTPEPDSPVTMQVDIIRPREIDATIEAAWRGFQAADPDLSSPFFTPDFARIVGEVRDDTRVAVMSKGGEITALFAYQHQRFGRLAPLAGQISDYHGFLARPDTKVDIGSILRAAGAQVYDYNHAPQSQQSFAAHAFRETSSPLVDLSNGFQHWFDKKNEETRAVRDLGRKARKLARENGELRLVANDLSDEAWAQFMDWKRESLAAQGATFILDVDWAREIARAVRETDTPGFGGMTSSLYAGDTLVAVHFGMRTDKTLHWWFPAYSAAHRNVSPGLVQIVEVLRTIADMGMTELDFGRGDQRYKCDLMNGERRLVEGSLERPMSLLGAPRRIRKGLQTMLAHLPGPAVPEFTRRAGDRILCAGRIS